jgi:hypothetical protein
MARKPFVVNAPVREKVRHLAGLGVRQDDIARIVECSPKTLRKKCRDDLDCGVAEANAIVSAPCSPLPRVAMSSHRSSG